MKLPQFDYAAPASLAEAFALLGRDGAKALSGGQSLLPVMAFRLASPSLLVDLRNIPGLACIDIDSTGVRLGARVRWRDIQDDVRLKVAHPLLRAAIAHVAHYQVRNRGTVGGSLAHADPAAEMPGIAVTCDAIVDIEGASGGRSMPAGEFFTGALATALGSDELIVGVRLPVWPAGRCWGFQEFARRRGDFALAAIAAYFDLDQNGCIRNPHIGVIGACHRPHRLLRAEVALEGRLPDDAAVEAAVAAAAEDLDPPSDFHASVDYRRSLASTLLERALIQAKP